MHRRDKHLLEFRFWQKVFAASTQIFSFLVACTQLYDPLCRSVRWSVRRSVTLSFFFAVLRHFKSSEVIVYFVFWS